MTEDQDLLAKIGQLAGQINQRKNQAAQLQRPYHVHRSYTPPHTSRPESTGWAPYRSRATPRRPITHRNRTLVMNNARAPGVDSTSLSNVSSDNDNEAKSGGSSGWVAKRDRHMQLINSAIYDKAAQARTKAIEETRTLKAQKRAKLEEAKVVKYAQSTGREYSSASAETSTTSQYPTSYQIIVNDTPFQVARGGGKLIRLSNGPILANTTPKRVIVGGVAFVRTKNGNLYRLGAVTSRRKAMKIHRKNELCKRFTRIGTCYKGPSCPYIHDPDKIAICKEFLQTGNCSAGEMCDLSHESSPHRSPVCMHFLRGRCSNSECRYAHIRVTPGAPVCRAFATLGYCAKGAECDERHVYECPEYANSGICSKIECKLPHVDRAGQIRKIAVNKVGSPLPDEDKEDISSEEEYDEIDSDDVDSDELDDDPIETIEAGIDNGELSGQQDFIHF